MPASLVPASGGQWKIEQVTTYVGEAASVLGLFELPQIVTVINTPCLLSYRWTVNKLELEFLKSCPSRIHIGDGRVFHRFKGQMGPREPTSRNSKP